MLRIGNYKLSLMNVKMCAVPMMDTFRSQKMIPFRGAKTLNNSYTNTEA